MQKRTITDETVRDRTGKSWEEWFALLDGQNATSLSHREIVEILYRTYKVNAWWSQMVTANYEQSRGMRQKYETEDGFEVSCSKTVCAPIQRVYTSWITESERHAWLDEDITIYKMNEYKSLRIMWTDGKKSVSVQFVVKPGDRTQVTVQHTKIPDPLTASSIKVFWQETLARLSHHLEQ